MIRALIVLISCSLLATTAFAMNWARDSEHGLSFAYPPDVFFPVAGDQKPSFRYYSDGKAAKLLIGSWTNENRMAPGAVKDWMIDNTGGYDEIVYRPGGRSWFVVSGYRGDKIVYQKVMFSCAGRLINILALVYPIAERAAFDPVVERMEDNFKPGQDCR